MKKRKEKIKFGMFLQEQGISPYALAKELSIAPQSIYRYIWGDREPNAKTMIKLAKILNVSGDEILEMFVESQEGDSI